MTTEQFDKEVDFICDSIRETLKIKAKEYRRKDNPLHNFDVGTSMSTTRESREDVIWGMARKHFISIQDIKSDVKEGKIPNKEVLDEKYGDMINYLILEKASIIDRMNESPLFYGYYTMGVEYPKGSEFRKNKKQKSKQ
jgi:hypothetical protein